MNKDVYLYVGTTADCICLMQLNTDTGSIKSVTNYHGLKRPTYQAISSDKKYLYSVNETDISGGVSSFKINANLSLTPINSQSIKGKGPCHVSLCNDEKYLFAAGYHDGTISLFPVNDHGSLGEMCDIKYHQGKSVNIERQNEPHAHCIIPYKDTDYIYAADLGTDKVYTYMIEKGKFVQGNPHYTNIHPGAGPRHLLFDSKGEFLYLINEVDNTVTVLKADKKTGKLSVIQDISTLPNDFKETSWCAAIRISPDERFVYASNRGHDSIAVFQRNTEGLLKLTGFIPSRGSWPRDFNIDPSGRFLITANQNSNSIYVHKLSKETGLGEFTGYSACIEGPVCVTFI